MVRGPEDTFIGGNTSLGLAMVMTLPLIIFLARSSSRPWLRRGMNVLAIAQIISTIFTYSRGALLGLAATVPLLFLRSKRKFFLLALLVPLAFFVEDLLPAKLIGRAQTIESYEQDSSAMLRFQAWSVAKNIAKERPLTGAGFNFEYGVPDPLWLSYADFLVEGTENSARAAHSIYFQILGQHGFVGLGLFVLLLVLLLRQLWRVRAAARKRSELEWVVDLAGTLQIALVGYLVSGAFLSLAYFDLLYTYVALAAILRREVAIAETAPVVAGPKVPSAGANIGGPAGAPAAGGSAASGLGSRPEAGR
jgi:probable O-glycosylation ligase (exosortase A-associated)